MVNLKQLTALTIRGLRSFLNGEPMKKTMKIIILRNVDGEWFFRVVGGNNKIVAVSESYSSFNKAEKSARLFNLPIKIKTKIK